MLKNKLFGFFTYEGLRNRQARGQPDDDRGARRTCSAAAISPRRSPTTVIYDPTSRS